MTQATPNAASAEVLGLKTAAVCSQLRRLREAVPQDVPLRRQVREIEFRVAAVKG